MLRILHSCGVSWIANGCRFNGQISVLKGNGIVCSCQSFGCDGIVADLCRTREGVDCYGLACLIYAGELGVTLPDYVGSYASADEMADISALIAGAAQSPSWRAVTGLAAFAN